MKWILAALSVLCFIHRGTTESRCILDVAIVVDTSGSITGDGKGVPENKDIVLNFIKEVVRNLHISSTGTHVGIVSYGDKTKLNFDLDDYTTEQEIVSRVPGIEWINGRTNTPKALRLARTGIFSSAGGDRSNVNDLCILLTDGGTSDEWINELFPEVRLIKNRGIPIFGVGVGGHVNKTELRLIAGNNESYFYVGDFASLKTKVDDIIAQSCVTVLPPSPTMASIVCHGRLDVVFVLDDSGSIEEVNFNKMKTFVANIIELMDLENGNVNVGVLTFSSNVRLQFHLNRYRSLMDAMSAVHRIPYTKGTTNTAAALSYVRNNMFTSGNGDRGGTQNVVFVITDGGSDNKKDTQNEAFMLRKSGAHIFVLGMGKWTDELELTQMASFPQEVNKIKLERFNDLNTILDKVVAKICNDNLQ